MSSNNVLISNESSRIDMIVKDVIPHSKTDGINENNCSYTCTACPTLFEWCIKDALGLSCNFTTCFLFLYGQFVMIFVILIPNNYSFMNYIHLFLLHCLEFLALSSYYRTMFTNPGAVPLNNATTEKLASYGGNGSTVYRCTMCQSIKPPRAHHCRICQRCIKRMDHHCMFVNNCVGQNNQKYFILFTFYTCIVSMYTLIILYNHLHDCITSNWTACPAWSPPMTFLFVILLGLASFGFFVFTAVMTSIQFYCIYTDTTGIEFFKGKQNSSRRRTSFLSALKTVFGSHVGLQWLNPFSRPINYITQNYEHITFDI